MERKQEKRIGPNRTMLISPMGHKAGNALLPELLKTLLAVFLLLSPQVSFGESGPVQKKFSDIHLNPDGISPSAECGKCHKDIHADWKNSLHARAVDNPVFRTAFLEAYFQKGEFARKACLSCHAPITYLNGDFELARPLTREGINCDYCHSIARTNPKNMFSKYSHELGLVKQGPLKDVKSPVHETRYNKLYGESAFCAGCHEYESPGGVKLIETFSEWEKSPYPEKGKHCQHCHMRKVEGKIVAEEVRKIPETEISSHDVAGGHSLSMREKSLSLEIKDIRINKQRVVVTVNITNKGAGHKIPTGLPSKKIALEVAIRSENGETEFIHKKIYQKRVVDQRGRPVTRDVDLMLNEGLKIQSDNRIGPLETRVEEFTFFVQDTREKLVSATAYYIHNPLIVQPSPIQIKLKEVTRLLRP